MRVTFSMMEEHLWSYKLHQHPPHHSNDHNKSDFGNNLTLADM